ncbi:chromosome condensation protein CrcB [Paenibacillus darwinianus]|uniref:Fluoride-specific ion channel FluC n=1 Tax=Paenibacillus darwinianus TaxID=1380763 RepID=A0A9W5S0D2_9BACL|nr:CrcB family protein [Paenibacillus darwinianus]EXX88147.1 chromosome condensation protein CrcB [Paenibacillus darwinianus]EXX88297.1 chromosome condensation protein CrcB [Paenibacillus darwinianus]EXX89860.1 chromosome condensation protein CrcB [Paenibacillus darwinianus]
MTELWLPLLVAVGGSAGSVCRYAIGRLFAYRGKAAPYGTLTVNLSGAALLGLLYGMAWNVNQPAWLLLLGTGFLGGYTTFSTLMAQLAAMRETRESRLAAVYFLTTLGGGLLLTACGFFAGLWLN